MSALARVALSIVGLCLLATMPAAAQRAADTQITPGKLRAFRAALPRFDVHMPLPNAALFVREHQCLRAARGAVAGAR